MVEVFKTNIDNAELAVQLTNRLRLQFPLYRINFDLHDCDNILRIEGESVCPQEIISLMNSHGYECHILD
jgi:hypothetical protein